MLYCPHIHRPLDLCREFKYEEPVSESLVERKLEQRVRQLLQEYMLDDFEVEEHDVVVTYADPTRPNHLQVSTAPLQVRPATGPEHAGHCKTLGLLSLISIIIPVKRNSSACLLKPVLNWANICFGNIVRSFRRI